MLYMNYRSKDKQIISEQFLSGVEIYEHESDDPQTDERVEQQHILMGFENQDEWIQTFYPETKKECSQRTQSIVNQLLDKYGDHPKKVLHLIVTHGYSVECFATNNGGKVTFPDYCSISGIEFKDKNISVIYDGESSHVTTKH